MFLSRISDFYKRFEKYISAVGLIYGFIFTSLTLTRVDAWLENFWIIVHLLVAGLGILALTYYEHKGLANWPKVNFYLTLIIQFAFGGLFSTFFVFYLRSTSLADSWFFLIILLTLLIGNEIWKKYYERLAFQVSVLFASLYLFLIFLLPVLWHRLGADLFVASGILSLIIIFFFTRLLKKVTEEKFQSSHNYLKTGILGIFLAMNILYFTNVIPPIPLALKESGVYHQIIKLGDGQYQLNGESRNWSDYFTRFPVFHARPGESVYVFSAIFSPVNFNTRIIHQWQYYDEKKEDWVNSNRVVLPIAGGRAEGYRTYSLKTNVPAGRWRVQVMTDTNQVLGNINFRVERVSTSFKN